MEEVTNQKINPLRLYHLDLRKNVGRFQEHSAQFRTEELENDTYCIDVIVGDGDTESFLYSSILEWASDAATLGATMVHYVDIPTETCIGNSDGAWKNVATFRNRKEAIAFAKEHFGADDNGMVCLISN